MSEATREMEIHRALGVIEGSLKGLHAQMATYSQRQAAFESKTEHELELIYNRINTLEDSKARLWGLGTLLTSIAGGFGYLIAHAKDWIIG